VVLGVVCSRTRQRAGAWKGEGLGRRGAGGAGRAGKGKWVSRQVQSTARLLQRRRSAGRTVDADADAGADADADAEAGGKFAFD
jgi:hypothetical protein